MYVCIKLRMLARGCSWRMHKYLHSGSSLLCTHWDSRSERWNMNDGMFLHSDRWDYSLQIGKNMQCFTAQLLPCIQMFKVVCCSYLWSGSSLPCTHWDSHSEQTTVNYYTLLHSDRLDYSLQVYVYDKMFHAKTTSMHA